ncbi:MAG: hypothetical protein QOH92_631 [Chloroflexota bacterium]|jgi:ADP-ribosylglycohydrolase|nr:hypothetical protein [Chloroflexota bacterium]
MTRQERVRSSASWAAWGDAIGFISELAPDAKVLRQRVGESKVSGAKPWTRRIGGQYGIDAELPAGTYSDDTQLRLATARAIRADGSFDVRSFAKVELVVWQAYALGGGRSTRAAAASLAQKSRDWFSNFFDGGARPTYEDSGGNGSAIRIQPHVWAARDLSSWPSFLRDVARNTVVTHGHPRGLVGAAVHAGSLAVVLETGRIPGPDEWMSLLDRLEDLPSIVREDEDLAAFWLPAWERLAKRPFERAVSTTIEESRRELELLRRIAGTDVRTAYEEMIIATQATNPASRGTATKTALLALALAWLRRDRPNEGLLEAANVLGSDTDSIASMAGALLGAAHSEPPPGPILDSEYILREADRLNSIAEGRSSETFGYPDPGRWLLPTAALDLVGVFDGHLGLAGLGPLEPKGREWQDHGRSAAVWHWARADFGQSLLIRRRAKPGRLPPSLVGRRWHIGDGPTSRSEVQRPPEQRPLFPVKSGPTDAAVQRGTPADVNVTDAWRQEPTVDEAYEDVRVRQFDAATVGRYLLELSAREVDGHAQAMAFSAMVAKGWRTRHTRSNGTATNASAIKAQILKWITPYLQNIPLRKLEYEGLVEALYWAGLYLTAKFPLEIVEDAGAKGHGASYRMSLNPVAAYTIVSDHENLSQIKRLLEDELIPTVRHWKVFDDVRPGPPG